MAATSAAMGDVIDLTGSAFQEAASATNANGITASDVFGYNSGVWHVSIPSASASGFAGVTLSDEGQGSIFLQGGAAINGTAGVFAAVKIDATQIGNTTPVSLNFDCVKSSGWSGTTSDTFEVTVQFIAYNESGESIGETKTWTQTVDCTTSTGTLASGVKMALDLTGEYDSYGIILSASRDGGKGGAVVQLENLTLVTTPEPTTATLSLLALAGLCARRRRK